MGPCIIFNPAARGDQARRWRDRLAALAPDAELRPTTGPGAARDLARDAVRAGFRTLIAAGGDGTVFEVLNGIADTPAGLATTTLGVLPLGTANVLAHELGLPADIPRAHDLLRHGHTRCIDCGTAEFADDQGQPRHAHFAIVAGAGLDARAVQLVNRRLKQATGKLAYIVSAVRALLTHPDRVRCTLAGQPFTARVVLAGNGRLYAGEIPLFHDGHLASGHLHLRAAARVTPTLLARCLLAFLTRQWTGPGPLAAEAVTEVQLDPEPGRRVPLQLDGEFVGWLPATLRLLPGVLRVLAPFP